MNTLGIYLEMHTICMYLDINIIYLYFKISTICRGVLLLHVSWDSNNSYVFQHRYYSGYVSWWILYLKTHTYYMHPDIHIIIGMHLEMNTTSRDTIYICASWEVYSISRHSIHISRNICTMYAFDMNTLGMRIEMLLLGRYLEMHILLVIYQDVYIFQIVYLV